MSRPPLPRVEARAAKSRVPRQPDFWRLWLVGLALNCVRWIETLAAAIFAYQETGSAFLVALLTLLRLLPMSLFGAFIGGVTDRLNRRTIIVTMMVCSLATSLTLLVLAYSGWLQVWHLGLASFIGGIGWAADHPVRRMMIAEAVGLDRLNVAMSIDAGANQSSRVVGPAAGGIVLATAGLVGCFAIEVALCVVALGAALSLTRVGKPHIHAPVRMLGHVLDGLRAALRDQKLRAALLVTVVFNLFVWPCLSMVPVIGKDQLHLDASGVGLLASMEGLGAILGSFSIGMWSRPSHSIKLYLGGTILADLAIIGFALAPVPALAGTSLLAFGFCGAGFSIMQATLLYRLSPPELRGRILGLISMCIGVGPIGFLQLGFLADTIGAPRAVMATALAGLALTAILYREWLALFRVDIEKI